jgi:hypothetical protein
MELASVFLAAERGIPHDPEQHAVYVGSWINALLNDKNEIFRAAHDASAATDFLLALERESSIADESLAAGPRLSGEPGFGATYLNDQTQQLDATVRTNWMLVETAMPLEPRNPIRWKQRCANRARSPHALSRVAAP